VLRSRQPPTLANLAHQTIRGLACDRVRDRASRRIRSGRLGSAPMCLHPSRHEPPYRSFASDQCLESRNLTLRDGIRRFGRVPVRFALKVSELPTLVRTSSAPRATGRSQAQQNHPNDHQLKDAAHGDTCAVAEHAPRDKRHP
jgi:hypothetical protein